MDGLGGSATVEKQTGGSDVSEQCRTNRFVPLGVGSTLRGLRAPIHRRSGNWAGFGAELDALRPLLEELSQHSAGR
jgi:hypothetical protein